MKLGKYDFKYQILISGQELEELQRFTGDMAESFGLDDRIYAYKGKRPIGLFRWDLECLEEVISWAIEDSETYRTKLHQNISLYSTFITVSNDSWKR